MSFRIEKDVRSRNVNNFDLVTTGSLFATDGTIINFAISNSTVTNATIEALTVSTNATIESLTVSSTATITNLAATNLSYVNLSTENLYESVLTEVAYSPNTTNPVVFDSTDYPGVWLTTPGSAFTNPSSATTVCVMVTYSMSVTSNGTENVHSYISANSNQYANDVGYIDNANVTAISLKGSAILYINPASTFVLTVVTQNAPSTTISNARLQLYQLSYIPPLII